MKVGDLVRWKAPIPELQTQVGILMKIEECEVGIPTYPQTIETALAADVFWCGRKITNTTINNLEVIK